MMSAGSDGLLGRVSGKICQLNGRGFRRCDVYFSHRPKKALQVSFIQDTLHTGAVMPPSPGVIGVGGGWDMQTRQPSTSSSSRESRYGEPCMWNRLWSESRYVNLHIHAAPAGSDPHFRPSNQISIMHRKMLFKAFRSNRCVEIWHDCKLLVRLPGMREKLCFKYTAIFSRVL